MIPPIQATVGQRVRFPDDHPTWPGMHGKITTIYYLNPDRPDLIVALDPVAATADELEAEATQNDHYPTPNDTAQEG